jgi:hypothetical protein
MREPLERSAETILFDLESAACAIITIALNEGLFNAPEDAQGLVYLASRIKDDASLLQGIAWDDRQAEVKAILALRRRKRKGTRLPPLPPAEYFEQQPRAVRSQAT